MGRGANGELGALSLLLPPSGIPLYDREGGVKLRWAVSQSGNVDDRGLRYWRV